jgi:hypothetical protein
MLSGKSIMPNEIVIDELYIVVGPSLHFRSTMDDYIPASEDLITPYDDSNMYNIFTNSLQVKKQPRPRPSRKCTFPLRLHH